MEKRGVKFGLLITLSLIIYFMVMKSLGLEHNVELRVLNAVFMAAGIFWCIKGFKDQHGAKMQFFSGIGLGLITSLTVAFSFSLFFAIFLGLNPSFLAELKTYEMQGAYMNAVGLVALIFIEATASGILFTYASMQWLKARKLSDVREM